MGMMSGMSTTAFSGADVDQLHAMASACAGAAQQLMIVARRTTLALCTQLTWNGSDADAMRASWQEEEIPAIAAVAGSLRDAGLHLVREAQEQLATSAVGASAGGADAGAISPAAKGAAAGSSSPDLRERLEKLRDALIGLPSVAMLGRILSEVPDLNGLPAAIARAEAAGSAFEKYGMKGLGLYSTIKSADGLVTAIENKDVAGVVENGVPLVFTAFGPVTDATLGTAWSAGSAIGTVTYDEMQGTRYGDIVQNMTDDAFTEHGAWGMLQVPGILGFAAYEYLTEDPPSGQ